MNRERCSGSHVELYRAAKAAVMWFGKPGYGKKRVKDEGASVWGDVATMSLMDGDESKTAEHCVGRSAPPIEPWLSCGVAPRDNGQ